MQMSFIGNHKVFVEVRGGNVTEVYQVVNGLVRDLDTIVIDYDLPRDPDNPQEECYVEYRLAGNVKR